MVQEEEEMGADEFHHWLVALVSIICSSVLMLACNTQIWMRLPVLLTLLFSLYHLYRAKTFTPNGQHLYVSIAIMVVLLNVMLDLYVTLYIYGI